MSFCHTCGKAYHYLGIARHRAMHRDRREKCVITLASGAWVWDYTEHPERQQDVDAETRGAEAEQ